MRGAAVTPPARWLAWAALAAGLAGCTCGGVNLEEGRYRCLADDDCLPGFRCLTGICARPDAGPAADGGTDGGCGPGGEVCPPPLHAATACVQGKCGRGACAAGFFDLDGEATPGCESSCAGNGCTFPDGGTVVVTQPPLPESGLVAQALASGSSLGAAVQTSASHTNLGILGEPTPPAEGGAVEQTNATHRNIGGFNSSLPRP